MKLLKQKNIKFIWRPSAESLPSEQESKITQK